MVLACWSGDPDEGQRALAPLRALATPIADAIELIPYPVMYAFTEAAAAPGAPAIRSMFCDGFSNAQIDAMIDALGTATAPMSMIQVRSLGGAMARVAGDETAFAHRDRRFCTNILAVWFDAAQDATPHRAWVESTWQALRPAARGVYANFLADEGEERVREAYPASTYERLARVKAAYDPANVFRFNQNVEPRA
jgi:FAD/FMN-containing dehydrogenase